MNFREEFRKLWFVFFSEIQRKNLYYHQIPTVLGLNKTTLRMDAKLWFKFGNDSHVYLVRGFTVSAVKTSKKRGCKRKISQKWINFCDNIWKRVFDRKRDFDEVKRSPAVIWLPWLIDAKSAEVSIPSSCLGAGTPPGGGGGGPPAGALGGGGGGAPPRGFGATFGFSAPALAGEPWKFSLISHNSLLETLIMSHTNESHFTKNHANNLQ